MKHIICWECDGKLWWVSYDAYGAPEQVQCTTCNGKGSVWVDDEFAEMMGGKEV